MMISLPDIRKSKGCVTQGYIRQFHVGEDARFKEEGVGIKSEPPAPRKKKLVVRYVPFGLSTRGLRDGKV
jgi:hypothetical protein